MSERYCVEHGRRVGSEVDTCYEGAVSNEPCDIRVLVPVTQGQAEQRVLDLLAEPWVSSALHFLRSRFEGRRCDSDGVADCERCSVMALVNVLTHGVVAPVAVQGIPVDDEKDN